MVLITLGAAAVVAVGGSALYYIRRRSSKPDDLDDLDDPAVRKILECRAQRKADGDKREAKRSGNRRRKQKDRAQYKLKHNLIEVEEGGDVILRKPGHLYGYHELKREAFIAEGSLYFKEPDSVKLSEFISLRNARCRLSPADETRRTIVVTAANNSDCVEFQVSTTQDATRWIKNMGRCIAESVDPTL